MVTEGTEASAVLGASAAWVAAQGVLAASAAQAGNSSGENPEKNQAGNSWAYREICMASLNSEGLAFWVLVEQVYGLDEKRCHLENSCSRLTGCFGLSQNQRAYRNLT